MISEKNNIRQTDFEGKKFLQRNIWPTKFLPWKELYLSWRVMSDVINKILHRCMKGKKIL